MVARLDDQDSTALPQRARRWGAESRVVGGIWVAKPGVVARSGPRPPWLSAGILWAAVACAALLLFFFSGKQISVVGEWAARRYGRPGRCRGACAAPNFGTTGWTYLVCPGGAAVNPGSATWGAPPRFWPLLIGLLCFGCLGYLPVGPPEHGWRRCWRPAEGRPNPSGSHSLFVCWPVWPGLVPPSPRAVERID